MHRNTTRFTGLGQWGSTTVVSLLTRRTVSFCRHVETGSGARVPKLRHQRGLRIRRIDPDDRNRSSPKCQFQPSFDASDRQKYFSALNVLFLNKPDKLVT